MPVDPTISLGVGVPQPAAGGMGQIGAFADVLNKLNQNQLFQQTFAARQRAGQIMSAAPDLESGYNAMLRDPLVAPFAGSIVNEARQAQLTMTQIAGEVQKQSQSGLEGVLKAVGGAYNNPAMLGPLMDAQLKVLSEPARKKVEQSGATGDIMTALTTGMPSAAEMEADPQKKAEGVDRFRKNWTGIATVAGLTPDVQRAITGTLPPAVSPQPFGPGGSLVPFQTGGSVAGEPANIPMSVAGQGPAGGTLALPPAPTGGAAALGASPAAPIRGLPLQTQKEIESSTKFGADVASAIQSEAQRLPEDLNRLQVMQNTMNKFEAGGFAGMRTDLAQFAQGLQRAGMPISDEMINAIGNKDLPAAQLFRSQMRPEVIGQLKQAAQGTGRVMRTEVDAFLAMMSENVDPEALRQMLNQAKYQAAVVYDRSQKYASYAGDPMKFESSYLAGFDPYALPTSSRPGGGGLNFEPIPPSAVKGSKAHPNQLWAGYGEQNAIPRGAVEYLKKHPETRDAFDQEMAKMGVQGASDRFLGPRR